MNSLRNMTLDAGQKIYCHVGISLAIFIVIYLYCIKDLSKQADSDKFVWKSSSKVHLCLKNVC